MGTTYERIRAWNTPVAIHVSTQRVLPTTRTSRRINCTDHFLCQKVLFECVRTILQFAWGSMRAHSKRTHFFVGSRTVNVLLDKRFTAWVAVIYWCYNHAGGSYVLINSQWNIQILPKFISMEGDCYAWWCCIKITEIQPSPPTPVLSQCFRFADNHGWSSEINRPWRDEFNFAALHVKEICMIILINYANRIDSGACQTQRKVIQLSFSFIWQFKFVFTHWKMEHPIFKTKHVWFSVANYPGKPTD